MIFERSLVKYNEYSILNETQNNNPYKKQATNITSISSSIIIYGGSGLLLSFGFCYLRTRIQCVYMPRRRLKQYNIYNIYIYIFFIFFFFFSFIFFYYNYFVYLLYKYYILYIILYNI